MVRERAEARDILCVVAWVHDLETIESDGDERLDAFALSGGTRMREHGQTSRAMDHVESLRDWEAILAHIRRTSVSEIAIERIAEVHRPSAVHERARHVRTSERPASRA